MVHNARGKHKPMGALLMQSTWLPNEMLLGMRPMFLLSKCCRKCSTRW